MTSAEMVVVGMKHIVCFSGGHSSAVAAVEVVRKCGIEEIDKKIASMHDHNLHKLNPMPAYGTTIF